MASDATWRFRSSQLAEVPDVTGLTLSQGLHEVVKLGLFVNEIEIELINEADPSLKRKWRLGLIPIDACEGATKGGRSNGRGNENLLV